LTWQATFEFQKQQQILLMERMSTVDTLATLTQAPNRLEITKTLSQLAVNSQLKSHQLTWAPSANGLASRELVAESDRLWAALEDQLQIATMALTRTQ
jgi:hypothetical protein